MIRGDACEDQLMVMFALAGRYTLRCQLWLDPRIVCRDTCPIGVLCADFRDVLPHPR